jgi:hypothetical protein
MPAEGSFIDPINVVASMPLRWAAQRSSHLHLMFTLQPG